MRQNTVSLSTAPSFSKSQKRISLLTFDLVPGLDVATVAVAYAEIWHGGVVGCFSRIIG
jgi:hypothetical protein